MIDNLKALPGRLMTRLKLRLKVAVCGSFRTALDRIDALVLRGWTAAREAEKRATHSLQAHRSLGLWQ